MNWLLHRSISNSGRENFFHAQPPRSKVGNDRATRAPGNEFFSGGHFLSSRGQIRLIGDGDTTQSAGTVYDIVALKSEME